jgi:hypothetical protein
LSGTALVINSTITLNTSQGGAGGFGHGFGPPGAEDPGNGGAASAGGVLTAGTSIKIMSTTIATNYARGGAAGLFYSGFGIGGTDASPGGSIAGGAMNVAGATAFVLDTIIANNAPGGGDTTLPKGADCYGSFTSRGYNVISHIKGGPAKECTGFGAAGDKFGGIAHVLDPKLGPLASNGGPTQTIALLPGSPAINAGDPYAGGCPVRDQRGYKRVARCDIGSFEYAGYR